MGSTNNHWLKAEHPLSYLFICAQSLSTQGPKYYIDNAGYKGSHPSITKSLLFYDKPKSKQYVCWMNNYRLQEKPNHYHSKSNLPIHKSLLNNQSLRFISRNFVVKPGLGPVDSWRNTMEEHKAVSEIITI